MNKSWEVILEEDENGEIILPFPPELIRDYGWQEGDEIDFKILDKTVLITNRTAKARKDESEPS
jgi:hypothetical protein